MFTNCPDCSAPLLYSFTGSDEYVSQFSTTCPCGFSGSTIVHLIEISGSGSGNAPVSMLALDPIPVETRVVVELALKVNGAEVEIKNEASP